MSGKKLRVLVVDDTIVYRKAVSDALAALPGVEVVGVAHDGKIALSKIKTLRPDLLTLDIEMPRMNGIEVLENLASIAPGIGVIMVSTLTMEGGEMTMRALELGAFDFITKPQLRSITENKRHLKGLLAPLVQAYRRTPVPVGDRIGTRKNGTRNPLLSRSPLTGRRRDRGTAPQGSAAVTKPALSGMSLSRRTNGSQIVTIGVSTGGPNALAMMLPQLPPDLGVPVLIVQHMPPVFTRSLAANLNAKCALTVKEAENGEDIRAGVVYIAPGGKQMKLAASADGRNRKIKITDDPPENSCKPAVDYLFRSVGDYYVGRTTAVIMTGMGKDGTKGLELLKRKGAYIIAQDKKSCVVYGMPKEPVERKIADIVVPLDRIAGEIIRSVSTNHHGPK